MRNDVFIGVKEILNMNSVLVRIINCVPVRCKLQDNYGKPNPRCWDLDTVKIDETLF